jgi:hypothetical protein
VLALPHERARELLREHRMLALPRRGDNLGCRAQMAVIKAQSGDKSAAVQMLTELEELSRHSYVPAYFRVLLCLSLGNRDEAIRWLEQSVTDHAGPQISYIKVDPFLGPLRGDPRFEILVQ